METLKEVRLEATIEIAGVDVTPVSRLVILRPAADTAVVVAVKEALGVIVGDGGVYRVLMVDGRHLEPAELATEHPLLAGQLASFQREA